MERIEPPAKLAQARDLLIALCNEHDATCALDQCDHACNIAAFIAHAIGIKTAAEINRMQEWLDRYNRECPKCTERN